MKHINIPVEDQLWRDLKQEALNEECSVASLVRQAIAFMVYGDATSPVPKFGMENKTNAELKAEQIVRSDKPFPTEVDVDRELLDAVSIDTWNRDLDGNPIDELDRLQDEFIASGMDFVSAAKEARRKVKSELPKVLPRK